MVIRPEVKSQEHSVERIHRGIHRAAVQGAVDVAGRPVQGQPHAGFQHVLGDMHDPRPRAPEGGVPIEAPPEELDFPGFGHGRSGSEVNAGSERRLIISVNGENSLARAKMANTLALHTYPKPDFGRYYWRNVTPTTDKELALPRPGNSGRAPRPQVAPLFARQRAAVLEALSEDLRRRRADGGQHPHGRGPAENPLHLQGGSVADGGQPAPRPRIRAAARSSGARPASGGHAARLVARARTGAG